MGRLGKKAKEKRDIWFAVLNERMVYAEAADMREDIAAVSAAMGFKRLRHEYSRVDIARNHLSRKFMEITKSPKDTLVMLDTDHIHPADIVARLVRHDLGVVGALCFRRGGPEDPQVYVRLPDGDLAQPSELQNGLLEATIVGSGAIAIQRWVFEKMTYPYWRMIYEDNSTALLGEDWYFGLECEKLGIKHYCDMTTISPHIFYRYIGPDKWLADREKREASEMSLGNEGGKWF